MVADEQQRQIVRKDAGVFQFENPRDQKIYETIKWLVADGPAEFFKDACSLMHDPRNLSTASHLIGHLMRELDSGIRAVLAPLAEQIDKDSTTKHIDGIKAILLVLKIPESEGPGKAWIDLAEKLHSKAHRPNLSSPRPLDDEFREDWQHFIRILEAVLDRFEKCYESIFKELDELLKAGTSPEDGIPVLQTKIPNSYVAFDYFFSRLQDPRWLQPLYNAKFFKELSLDRPCPQTKYLERMAALTECQQVALDIILAVETESIGARCDLADATLALPAASGVKTVPKFIGYLETSPNLFVLPYALTKLAKHLASECPKEAQDLTTALLVITPQEGDGDIFHEPKTRIQSHDYGHVLEEVIPPLVESGGFPVFELLSSLLAAAVESRRGDGEEREFDDNSYIERHAIDGYGGVHMSHEVMNGLITAVYQTAGKILAKDSSVMKRIINVLDAKRWTVFQRIALQLLCDSADPRQELVAQKLLDKDLWDNEATKREYFLLAETHSGLLIPTQREEIARRIQAGPEWTIEDLEQEQINRLMRAWRWRRLVPFREILPPQLQRECDDIVDDLGEPPDEPVVSSARCIGSVSPIEKDELKAKTIEEIVAYLQKWVPTGEWEEPDPDGLGDVLRNIVAEDPVHFAEKAELFAEVDPTYVRSVLSGFGEAVKAERLFPWAAVLKLCATVVLKPVKIPGRATRRIFDFDADWNGARRGILDLLTKGLMEGPASIPFHLRADVWTILRTLTEDSDPTPEDEAKQDRKNMNSYDEAVNTMRGNALETVIFYVSWVLRELKVKASAEGRIDGGMQHVPEAVAVFEAHLDPQREPSASIHSLYGKWLPNLDYTDHEWTERMLPSILPRDPALHLRDAAWNTYLLYSGGPYNKTASMLIPEYRFFADHLEAMPSSARGDLKEAFATHLVFLYLRGILKKDGEDGTIAAFLQKADAKLRGQFVRIMGDIVRHNKKPSREWIDRAMDFWEQRLQAAKTAVDPNQHIQEMDAFGYWFVSRKFDDDWALKNLESALLLGSDIEFDYLVVENMESMARTRPLECARCLQLIVTSKGKSMWDVRLLVKHVRAVLDVISTSGDAEAKVIGDEVVSALLARGHQEIRETTPVTLAV